MFWKRKYPLDVVIADLCYRITGNSMGLAELLRSKCVEIGTFKWDKKKHDLVISELCYVQFHVLYRMAFHQLKADQFALLNSGLFEICIDKAAKASSETRNSQLAEQERDPGLFQFDINQFHHRMNEYSECKELVAPGNESQENSIFWRFGIHVSQIITGLPTDIRIILPAVFAATTALKVIDFQSGLENVG